MLVNTKNWQKERKEQSSYSKSIGFLSVSSKLLGLVMLHKYKTDCAYQD